MNWGKKLVNIQTHFLFEKYASDHSLLEIILSKYKIQNYIWSDFFSAYQNGRTEFKIFFWIIANQLWISCHQVLLVAMMSRLKNDLNQQKLCYNFGVALIKQQSIVLDLEKMSKIQIFGGPSLQFFNGFFSILWEPYWLLWLSKQTHKSTW